MNRTQKILASFVMAAAAASGAARAADQSAFFECARGQSDGSVKPCSTPEADRAEAHFIQRAEAKAKSWEHATASTFRKTEPARTTDVERIQSDRAGASRTISADTSGQ